jgi:hypothetical protein
MLTWARAVMHDEADGTPETDIRPVIGGTGAKNGENRWPEQKDLGDGADDIGGYHQPSGQEAEVRIDRPANPLEGGAAVGVP